MIAQFCEWQGIHFKKHLHSYRLGQSVLAEVYMRKFCELTTQHSWKQDVSPHFVAFTHAIFLSKTFFTPTPYSMFLENCCLSSRTHPTRQLFLKVFPDLISIHYLMNIGNFPLESQSSLHLPWSQPLSPHITLAPIYSHLAQGPFWAGTVLFILYAPFLAHGLTNGSFSVNGFQWLTGPTVLLKR